MATTHRGLIKSFWDYLNGNDLEMFQEEHQAIIHHVGLNAVVLKLNDVGLQDESLFMKIPWRPEGLHKLRREIEIINSLKGKIGCAPELVGWTVPSDAKDWRFTFFLTPAYRCSFARPPLPKSFQFQMAQALLDLHRKQTFRFVTSHETIVSQNVPNKLSWIIGWASSLKRQVSPSFWQDACPNSEHVVVHLRDEFPEWSFEQPSVCQGDAALRNWCQDTNGRVLLIDWENWTLGSIELDVAMLLIEDNPSEDFFEWTSWRPFLERLFPDENWVETVPFLTIFLLLLIQNWIWSRRYLELMETVPEGLRRWLPYSARDTNQYLKRMENEIQHVKHRIVNLF